MDIRYNISEIFQAAFGINSPIYMVNPIEVGKSPNGINYTGVEWIAQPEAKKMSWLGTPIIHPITLKGGTHEVYNRFGKLIEKTLGDFEMPAATLCEFRRAKNITQTNVLGSNGTVKEIFGFDDWQISFKGVCLPEPGRTEVEQKEMLLQLEKVAGRIEVIGELFDEKDINAIVISEVSFPQIQGKPRVIPFEINALSDEVIDLELLPNGIQVGDATPVSAYDEQGEVEI